MDDTPDFEGLTEEEWLQRQADEAEQRSESRYQEEKREQERWYEEEFQNCDI